jgi:hypothetical protein
MIAPLLLFLACTSSKDADTAADDTPADDTGGDDTDVAAGPGTLAMSFRMDGDYIAAMAENGQTPTGTFGGSIYADADATGVGPNDGAVPLAEFSVEGVDLTADGGPTAVLYTSDPLPAQIVWVLGCLDVDVPEDGCGDQGDPITIPGQDKVQIVGDASTPFEVYMGMLRP